jgi:hypothetical protein
LLVVGGGGFHGHIGWVAACISGFVTLSLVIGWLPMTLAMTHLKHFEG